MYPYIERIEDVLPHIENDSAFRVVEKDCGNTYINYNHMGMDVFPPMVTAEELDSVYGDEYAMYCLDQHTHHTLVRRECRGITFNTATGVITSRPFHKFFNAGERDEVSLDSLDFSRSHVIMDKMDGSMIRPIFVNGGVRWGTKMGLTDVAKLAEHYAAKNPQYDRLALMCKQSALTPIFEYVSRDNRIVVDYPDRNMVLLAIRHNESGKYYNRIELMEVADTYGVPVVHTYAHGMGNNKNLSAWDVTTKKGIAHKFVQSIRQSVDIPEGVVITWEESPNLFVKIKTEAYCALHTAKEEMATERRIIKVIMADTVDDLLPILPDEERDRLLAYVDSFWNYVNKLASVLQVEYEMVRHTYDDKKSFALSDWAKDNPEKRPIMFALWDNKFTDASEAALSTISSGLTSETKWIETKEKWNIPLDWNELEEVE